MRLASGFFASSSHFKLNEHKEAFNIETPSTWSWFYLRKRQLLLFFQDATHLVTKWRNRLLSSTAQLHLGRQRISMEHLIDILNDNTYSKLDHGLTRTDLNPKDKQNYHSCVRIASDDVLSILVKNHTTYGTYVYLLLLKMIINTYVEKTTRIDDRMYRRAKHDQRDSQLLCLGLKSAWCIVVICRLWWIWVQKKAFSPAVTATTNRKRNNKDKFFITRTAYLSVELNAHNLLYIILLVKQRHLPKEALNIFLFNS